MKLRRFHALPRTNYLPPHNRLSVSRVDNAEDEVARLRWEVAKANKEAVESRGEAVDDLQIDINIYRAAYWKRLSGQDLISIFFVVLLSTRYNA